MIIGFKFFSSKIINISKYCLDIMWSKTVFITKQMLIYCVISIFFYCLIVILLCNSSESVTENSNSEVKVGLFLIGIHSMHNWTSTMRHAVTRKRSTQIGYGKQEKHIGNRLKKNLQLKDVCLLDLKPLRS